MVHVFNHFECLLYARPVLELYKELHDLGLASPAILAPPHPHLALCTPALRNLFLGSTCAPLSSVLQVFADALPAA